MLMNGMARGTWKEFSDMICLRKVTQVYRPDDNTLPMRCHEEWLRAVKQLTMKNQ